MKTFLRIIALLALLACMFCVAIWAMCFGPHAALPTLAALALVQAVLAGMALYTIIGVAR